MEWTVIITLAIIAALKAWGGGAQMRDPLQTTVKITANVRATVNQIQNKIVTYGVCSDREFEFLQQHCDVGQLRQKEPV